MCRRALAIYCFIVDLLKASRHLEDSRAEVSGSEAINIAAMLHFGGNFERSRLTLPELGLMRRLQSRA